MKVKEIYIKDFRQFKDLTLDLTYPKGHTKEGLPLEKVCIIGQSGTGKTNLLKLLYLLRMPGEWRDKQVSSTSELIDNIAYKVSDLINNEFIASFKYSHEDNYALSENLMSVFNKNTYPYSEILNEEFGSPSSDLEDIFKFMKGESKQKDKLIYFPAGLKYDFKETQSDNTHTSRRVFDFSKQNIYGLWNSIVQNLTKYQEEELKIRQKISVLAEQGNIEATQKEVTILKEWKDNNANPLKAIAEKCINPLIKNFSLRVKENLNIEQKEDIGFIKLENYDGQEMPYNAWSTGTKQVVLSALPLYLIQPENSTVLFDEPETSLYPDLQRIIIDYYQGLTKETQFFYATHSPIIASCFEPWEIVELKFNGNGHVYREKYYEEENHIDNYYIDPRFLNFDLMLKEVFDMQNTNGDKRYEALSEYKMLKNQLDTFKVENQLQTAEAKDIYQKFKSLSKKLVVNPE